MHLDIHDDALLHELCVLGVLAALALRSRSRSSLLLGRGLRFLQCVRAVCETNVGGA